MKIKTLSIILLVAFSFFMEGCAPLTDKEQHLKLQHAVETGDKDYRESNITHMYNQFIYMYSEPNATRTQSGKKEFYTDKEARLLAVCVTDINFEEAAPLSWDSNTENLKSEILNRSVGTCEARLKNGWLKNTN